MIHILDYGLGNINAFATAYKLLGRQIIRAREPKDLNNAKKIILPGVGSFDEAIKLLNSSGLRLKLEDLIAQGEVNVLGVCVGMQILASGSEEGKLSGLGLIPGTVKQLPKKLLKKKLRLPHMGWNSVKVKNHNPLFYELNSEPRFYFLHSYYFDSDSSDYVGATAHYGIEFASSVFLNRIYGVQFHPEKSHNYGLKLLENFANI